METGGRLERESLQEQSGAGTVPKDWLTVPPDLPVPTDDGEADHLCAGATSPIELPEGVKLRATPMTTGASSEESGSGTTIGVSGEGQGQQWVDVRALSFDAPVLVFVYPRSGVPGVPSLPGWDAIPGARGCTPELCSVRDTLGELRTARPGGVHVVALSTQSASYQSEVATRLSLPYHILSDEGRAFSGPLRLPTFEAEGLVLLKRITLLIYKGKVVGRDYPVFPTDQAARMALNLLKLKPKRSLSTEPVFEEYVCDVVSIRAPCCKQWFDCSECHAETQDHQLKKTTEMAFACKKCKKAFRKDMSNYEDSDEYCPHCDNHYVIEAKTPQAVVGVEGEDARVDSRMLKDERVRQDTKRTIFRREDFSDILG